MSRGRIAPATREAVREWLARFDVFDEVHFALEGTTGWRFVAEEIARVGHRAHLADPAETAAKRGRKRRAKTDRADCDLLLRLLAAGELPESWIPPAQILELRTRVRLRKALVDERTGWQQRLQAQLFHQGVPAGLKPRPRGGREALPRVDLSPAGRELVTLALRMIDRIDRELAPLDRLLSLYARRQPGCRELIARLYGVGPVTATAIVAELGDARRFGSSDDAVRHCGLDVTVHQSDNKRAPGHLSHEGPGLLRWALFEAAQQACRPASPDHDYYRQVARRIDHNRACLSVARKLCRRTYHILRELGDEALAPIDAPTDEGWSPPQLDGNASRAPARCHEDVCGRLPNGACRQRPSAWTASKDRATANATRGIDTRSIILSPDALSAHLGKAGRPRGTNFASLEDRAQGGNTEDPEHKRALTTAPHHR